MKEEIYEKQSDETNFSLLLCLVMVLGCLPLNILAVAGDPCAEDGCHGTYDNRGICSTGNHYEVPALVDGYYQISNAGQLKWFVDQVNSSYTETINAVLANTTDSRLVLTATITWGEEKLPLTHVFRAATLTSFAQSVEDKLAANEPITTAIVLTITGLDVLAEGEDLYLQPTLTSDTTVSGIGAKVAYIR